jgi:hypothetical protein
LQPNKGYESVGLVQTRVGSRRRVSTPATRTPWESYAQIVPLLVVGGF